MEEPLVSVIMPAFNDKSKYIKESIESILSQTYNNIELIIADDSTDEDSIAVINMYAQNNNKIKLCRVEGRRGICAALNDAIKMSQGEYIAHMDADDISYPNRIEIEMHEFDDPNVVVVGGQSISIDDKSIVFGDKTSLPLTTNEIYKFLEYGRFFMSNPASIIKKSVLEEVGLYDVLIKSAEDFDVWHKIAALGYKMVNVPDVVLKYRCHDNNHHKVHHDLMYKMCCLSRIKYSLDISRCLTKSEYDLILNIIDENWVCKLDVATSKQISFASKLLQKTGLSRYVYYFTIKYFKHRKDFYKSVLGV